MSTVIKLVSSDAQLAQVLRETGQAHRLDDGGDDHRHPQGAGQPAGDVALPAGGRGQVHGHEDAADRRHTRR